MKSAVQSVLTAGVAVVGASAIAIAPSVQPLPSPAPAIQLAAEVQPLALEPQPPLLTVLLNSPLALLGPAATAGTLPPPPAPTQFAIAPNLADTIDSIYIAVEPWVQYGFEVATAVVRWIPYVGWFAGLIMDGYFFGESLVASGVFNFTDWLRGNGSVVENLVDFGIDVGLAFVWLGIDALNSFIPLPPCCYPPRPPVQGPFLAQAEVEQAAVEQTVAPAGGESEPATTGPLQQLLDRVFTPVDAAASVLTRTVDVVTGAVTGMDVEPDAGILGSAVIDDVVPTLTPKRDLPGIVPDKATGPLADIVSTLTPKRDLPGLRNKDAVKATTAAPGEIRGGVTKALKDVSQAARSDKRGALRQAVAVADATSTVADGVTKGVKKAQKATDDVRTPAKAPKANSED